MLVFWVGSSCNFPLNYVICIFPVYSGDSVSGDSVYSVSSDGSVSGDTSVFSVSSDGSVSSDTSCLLYTSPSPRDATLSRMPSSA